MVVGCDYIVASRSTCVGVDHLGGVDVGHSHRVRVEERGIKRELDGYAAYAERARYRLFPFVR